MKCENQRNPILPLSVHVPDSEGHVMPDGRLYVYGSFDNREDVYCSEEYHVVSTSDMKTWEIEDEPSLSGKDIPWFGDPNAPKYYVDDRFGEKLAHLEKGSSAVFRYVKSENDWTGIELTAAGSGRVHILLNGNFAGAVAFTGSENFAEVRAEISMDAGEYELALEIDQSDGLEIAALTLYAE